MKPSGECSSFPFSISNIIYPPLSHWLRLLRRWLPVCPLLESGKVRVDGLSFYTRLCLNRSTTPFACLHQAVLDSLHQTICLLASGCAWIAPPHRLLACIRFWRRRLRGNWSGLRTPGAHSWELFTEIWTWQNLPVNLLTTWSFDRGKICIRKIYTQVCYL